MNYRMLRINTNVSNNMASYILTFIAGYFIGSSVVIVMNIILEKQNQQ